MKVIIQWLLFRLSIELSEQFDTASTSYSKFWDCLFECTFAFMVFPKFFPVHCIFWWSTSPFNCKYVSFMIVTQASRILLMMFEFSYCYFLIHPLFSHSPFVFMGLASNCSSGWPRTHQVAQNLRILSTGIIGMGHYTRLHLFVLSILSKIWQ